MATVAAWTVAACGLVLVAIGAYFVAVRPALLAEDERFIGVPGSALSELAPGLERWLDHVFRVLGAYIASVGVLVAYVGATGLRTGSGAALAVLATVWVTSIAAMAVVNMIIDSDFKWALASLAGVWGTALPVVATAR